MADDPLEKLRTICDSLKREIQSPHDLSVEEALKLILEELIEQRKRIVTLIKDSQWSF